MKRERQCDHPNPIQDSNEISQKGPQKKWTFREQKDFQERIKKMKFSDTLEECHQVSKNRQEKNKDTQPIHLSFYFENGSLKLKLNSFVSRT